MTAPAVSVIVIGYRMSTQLARTLQTLSPGYQRGVNPSDYEVIVVENSSDDNLAPTVVAELPDNFHYTLRDEAGHSPVPAINFAFSQCRGACLGLIMDGARMASPGIIRGAMDAMAVTHRAVVVVPGYHLGEQEQHLHDSDAAALAQEQILLESVDWQTEGYELFTIATFSGANPNGYLQPIMECNCVFASAESFREVGYADPQFTMPGGGSVNLHIYRSLGMLAGSRIFVLPGEGSFHQYHGGVTTSSYEDRQAELERHRVQLHSPGPGGFNSLRRSPTRLGEVPLQAYPFLEVALERSRKRLHKRARQNLPAWPDDPATLAEDT